MTKIKSIVQYGGWKRALNAARLTANKEPLDKEPSSEWKRKVIMAEHSPIRMVEYDILFEEMPTYTSVHIVRHHVGCEKFVGTQRDSRVDNPIPRGKKYQDAPVKMLFSGNSQALINVSRKRLCSTASAETRHAWKLAIEELRKIDPELADACVPECVYRGFCPEKDNCCGYVKSEGYKNAREKYIEGFKAYGTE